MNPRHLARHVVAHARMRGGLRGIRRSACLGQGATCAPCLGAARRSLVQAACGDTQNGYGRCGVSWGGWSMLPVSAGWCSHTRLRSREPLVHTVSPLCCCYMRSLLVRPVPPLPRTGTRTPTPARHQQQHRGDCVGGCVQVRPAPNARSRAHAGQRSESVTGQRGGLVRAAPITRDVVGDRCRWWRWQWWWRARWWRWWRAGKEAWHCAATTTSRQHWQQGVELHGVHVPEQVECQGLQDVHQATAQATDPYNVQGTAQGPVQGQVPASCGAGGQQ